MLDIENFDKKFKLIVNTYEWKRLQESFNECDNIFIFGHGGNMAIADHAAIDMSRLTNKNVMAPGSGITATSIISDESFDTWISKWLEFRTKYITDMSKCLAIGISCSTSGRSSNCLVNALNWAQENGMKTGLLAAQEKEDLNKDIVCINQNCIYYHTSEIISMALTYELIHSAGFNCPSIRHKANKRRFESLNIESEVNDVISNANVPPGFEHEQKNIAIDFDGVIHNFDKGWYDGTCYGGVIDGSREALEELSQHYNIVIFSSKCRPDRPLVDGKTGLELVNEWLKEKDLIKYVDYVTYEKPRAEFYIDDKAVNFDRNWNEVLKRVL